MSLEDNRLTQGDDLPGIIERVRARTPARILSGRSGAAYRTNTQLELREAHAAARDAVRTESNLLVNFGDDFVQTWKLFEVGSRATSKDEYLLRPDLGRALNEAACEEVKRQCSTGHDLQIAIGDGLSVAAVVRQVPHLLPLLAKGGTARGWTIGRAFVIRHCRVGILNEIGDLLTPTIAVLLIGERPGLATAESLSAYMAYRPKEGDTDANRNLVSNIHARGLSHEQAAERILDIAAAMMRTKSSGSRLAQRTLTEN